MRINGHTPSHLEDDEETDTSSKFRRSSIHSCHDIDNGLSDGDDHAKHCQSRNQVNTTNFTVTLLTLLSSIEESSVLWGVSNLQNLGSGQELHDEGGGDDGRDTQLHEGAAIGGHDHSQPVEWISTIRRHDPK